MRPLRTAALAVAVALAWALVVAHVAIGDLDPGTAVFHATAGWWGALTPAVLATCGLARRWRLVGLAALPVVAWLGWVVPGTLGAREVPQGAVLRLVSANVLMVNGDPTTLLSEVFGHDPDVVVLQEYSPWFFEVAAPYRLTHPHHVERPETHSFGTAVFSRLPLEGLDEVDLAGVPMLTFTVRVEGRPVRVFVLHTLPPINAENFALWTRQLTALAERAAHEDGPLVVAGDLNATRHHPSYRTLLRDGGLRDGHAEVGRAGAWTWPNGRLPVPPLRLDHLLLRGGVVGERIEEGRGWGSDHRPVIGVLRVP